jgi:membrane fusion protein, multidrug efflux system
MRLPKTVRTRTREFLLALIPASVFVVAGCGGSPSRPQAVPVAEGLHTETIQPQSVPNEIQAPGSVISTATAQLAARTTGTVLLVPVREGDTVRPGELLAQLDEAELVARKEAAQAGLQQAVAGVAEATRGVAAAQAQANVAKQTYDRYVYLRDQKSVSPQEFDEVQAKQLAAQAGFQQAQARLQQADAAKSQAQSDARAASEVAGYARIVAPFDGRIVRRMVDPGSLVMPGTPLFVVEDASHYELAVTIPADAIGSSSGKSIRRGSQALVVLDTIPGRTFDGRVAEIEAGADPSSHTVKARISLPRDPAIRSGLFGRAWFERGTHNAIVVPNSAVVERGQLRGVYTVDSNGMVQWRVLTLGRTLGDRVEILSGLSADDRIVLDPGDRDLGGMRIQLASTPVGGQHP